MAKKTVATIEETAAIETAATAAAVIEKKKPVTIWNLVCNHCGAPFQVARPSNLKTNQIQAWDNDGCKKGSFYNKGLAHCLPVDC